VILPKALVSYGDQESAWGAVRVDRETVTVIGDGRPSSRDMISWASRRITARADYWSGKFNVGLTLRAGNTEQADW
jgi:hypothetical protein